MPEARVDDIGLIVALPAEARSLGMHGVRPGGCARRGDGWVAVSGIGPSNAAAAAERLLGCGVGGLASWGVAGALDPGLAPGDLMVPERVRDQSGDPGFAIDRGARERVAAACQGTLRIHGGTLWSSSHPITTIADKRALAARSGALAVDMEAAAVARIAAGAGLPFLAVKAICDPLQRELPARMLSALEDTDGRPSLRMLAAIVLGGPTTWATARLLAGDFSCARRSLRNAARLAA